jgi:hypothetical protein
MAHGRISPDIVMTIRYAGASQIQAVSHHEENRTKDGTSAIDEDRTHLNRILHGPGTQQEAVDDFWDAQGVKRPAQQSETPFVQMVLSASPEYFRTPEQGAGEWHAAKLRDWQRQTMSWLNSEYGRDLAHVSLHLDEDTPHMHVLVIPTYDKKPRRPGRKKRNETTEEFEARKASVETAPMIRVAGRSSNSYWKKAWCRRIARQSYHASVKHLGLGYGKDFIGDDEPSPKRKETGTWVREQAAMIRDEKAQIEAEWNAIDAAKKQNMMIKAENDKISDELDQREAFMKKVIDRVWSLAERMADRFGLPLPKKISEALDELETAVDDYNATLKVDDDATPSM